MPFAIFRIGSGVSNQRVPEFSPPDIAFWVFQKMSCFAILRAWYRLQKPLNPENTKKLRKNTKSPSRVGPENTKKIPKKTKMAQKSPFLYFFGISFVFSGPNPGRGICIFFVIFSYFRDSGVFVICTRPAGSQVLVACDVLAPCVSVVFAASHCRLSEEDGWLQGTLFGWAVPGGRAFDKGLSGFCRFCGFWCQFVWPWMTCFGPYLCVTWHCSPTYSFNAFDFQQNCDCNIHWFLEGFSCELPVWPQEEKVAWISVPRTSSLWDFGPHAYVFLGQFFPQKLEMFTPSPRQYLAGLLGLATLAQRLAAGLHSFGPKKNCRTLQLK